MNWAVSLSHDFPIIFQRVISYELTSSETAIVSHKGNKYEISVDSMRRIDSPKYVYGDSVSPANHPELVGVVCEMIYHFNRNEPQYFIKVDGKKKSKRYFADELICRN